MKFFTTLFFCLLFGSILFAQSPNGYLTNNGTWCWFSDPRAVIVDNMIFTGWVTSEGTVEAAKLDLDDQSIQKTELYYKLQKDDHNNPAFVLTESGKLISMYTRHGLKDLFINVLEDLTREFDFAGAQLIHPISKEELERYPRESMSYANPYQLKGENGRLYCFGRWTGFKPNLMWSDDEGKTWSQSKVFITNHPFDPGNRPYVKYYSDGQSRIHMVFTDGHPRVEPTNSVYYAYYENGKFHRANGEVICDMNSIPFEPKEASVIFQSNETEGRAWIADISQDNEGNPVVLYTKSPEETDHRYWYARYVDGKWINQEICKSGKWFPQTPEGKKEPEPHYFGGLSVHPGNANVVYLSRQVNGIFEIERWQTNDYGKSWTSEAITKDSEYHNVRPYVPRGLKAEQAEVVLWMENQKYIHYTNYQTSVKFYIAK